jgi:hypothetical protein
MSDDPASLANLRDIVASPLPSFWPPAAGVAIVAACALAFFAIKAVHVVLKARKNAYRRAAAAEIDRICGSPTEGAAVTVAAVSAVLKRAALVAYPREVVAPLSGPEWASFIEKTSANPNVGELKEFLSRVSDRALHLQPGDLGRLAEQARSWAREHRPLSSGG